MTIAPWRASCIQMASRRASDASNRAAASVIIAENVACAASMIHEACDCTERPQLVVLPEFALTGPPPLGGTVQHWIDNACAPIPGEITAPLQALAAERGIFIAGNQFESSEQWPGRYFNTCFLIDPKGEVILRYRRINTATFPSPHDCMDRYLDRHGPAGTFPVVDTELGRLAMLPCGEIAVPEMARVLMMRGAEVILHPTNEAYSAAQEAAKIARAAENMVYLVSANVAGGIGFSADGSVLGGRSRIVDFRGDTLVFEADPIATVRVSAVINVETLRGARRDLGTGNTLLRTRWEMYRPYYKAISVYPPNHFLDAPMQEVAAPRPLAEAALANLVRAGVVVPA
jgi:predicted amidohydrolase